MHGENIEHAPMQGQAICSPDVLTPNRPSDRWRESTQLQRSFDILAWCGQDAAYSGLLSIVVAGGTPESERDTHHAEG